MNFNLRVAGQLVRNPFGDVRAGPRSVRLRLTKWPQATNVLTTPSKRCKINAGGHAPCGLSGLAQGVTPCSCPGLTQGATPCSHPGLHNPGSAEEGDTLWLPWFEAGGDALVQHRG